MMPFGVFAPDRLQVLVLGPGYGESVLVRVPGSPPGWMVVDSLLSGRRADAQCFPLKVFERLGVEPDLVLLTHTHEDHAAGMDLMVEQFGRHAAFGAVDVDLSIIASARVRRAAQSLEAAAALRAIGQLPPQRRWDLDAGPRQLGDGSVTVLHPLPTRLRELLDMPSIEPNQLSSAVLVDWGDRSVLLGADLIRPEWTVVPHGDRLRRCNPVKVPHHGSAGAFDAAWVGDQLQDPDNAVRRMLIAPFDRNPKLPDVEGADGLSELLRQVDAVHVTSLPFRTDPTALGTVRLESLRAAKAASAAAGTLPSILGAPSAPQIAHDEWDAWLLADLSANGICRVRGGAAHVSVIR